MDSTSFPVLLLILFSRSRSARHLLDEIDKKAAGTREDPFRVLSDDLLDHIMSFLPGDDALQTCVLDTQWRDLWRRKTSLRFIFDEWSSFSRERFSQLVKLIIHLKGDSPLTDCQITQFDEDYFTEAKLLIEYVLKCRVEDLLVFAAGGYLKDFLLLDARLISRHLRTIEFGNPDLVDSSIDFSGCPVLEKLTLESGYVDLCKICSKSLKHLRLTGWSTFSEEIHVSIAAPRLISLELGRFDNMSPSLEEMPLLEKASILLEDGCYNVCQSDWGCTCYDKKCLPLNGLSNAVDLKLIAEPKLNFVGATGSKQSFVCASSLAVNIKCRKVDEGVSKIWRS
ncbi:F-box/LRR-repeat protein 25-like [Aegilops tauschii subsp. strangulata]|uniref:F-box/LRR-repeat protein 25-like n=1 Tax=Aegilops tauschii subsp. strangulata TaxID=200361 RepID=UPI00098AE0E6|nr:F-box/LRR-repeat protein At3g26922-like [Aegilops tauschii subsp. strangulata]